jgi:hypothetical protein
MEFKAQTLAASYGFNRKLFRKATETYSLRSDMGGPAGELLRMAADMSESHHDDQVAAFKAGRALRRMQVEEAFLLLQEKVPELATLPHISVPLGRKFRNRPHDDMTATLDIYKTIARLVGKHSESIDPVVRSNAAKAVVIRYLSERR